MRNLSIRAPNAGFSLQQVLITVRLGSSDLAYQRLSSANDDPSVYRSAQRIPRSPSSHQQHLALSRECANPTCAAFIKAHPLRPRVEVPGTEQIGFVSQHKGAVTRTHQFLGADRQRVAT